MAIAEHLLVGPEFTTGYADGQEAAKNLLYTR
jgi:hypothetical protein